MKHALLFCFFSVFIIGLANCECIPDCTNTFESDIVDANVTQICTTALDYLSCLSSCSIEMASYIHELENAYGTDCDLSAYSGSYSGSTSQSISFLTFLVGPLLAAYGTFGL
ncbi:uncharacterized protein LOC112573172 isoform X1 [Pomacea canaliculata]|uniref:uncharacterized protein LOC112573172 isoform X1 n=1 Tax=Pomacea canaliculata TaxID=400727 RepID=UPI000D7293DB|nr:uncharacterized protein LOC112573172 isoform X1 [Pomacea canaliculata]